MMTATVIPAERLNTLRQRRGLVAFTWRRCVLCSHPFRTSTAAQCVCNVCRKATVHLDFGR